MSVKTVNPRHLALQLALLVAMTPFAIDTYLPAFPAMAESFGVNVERMGYTVSVYLLGFAGGQLLGGPLSDRYGRKLIGIIGLVTFLLTSLMIIFSQDFHHLALWRAVQALGGGFSTVIVAAIIRDNFSGRESAQVFSTMGMIMMVAPMVAPAVGSFLLHWGDWKVIFWFLSGYALLLVFVLTVLVPSTHKPVKADHSLLTHFARSYGQVLANTRALPNLFGQACISGILFTFVTNAAYIFLEFFQVRDGMFPWIFASIVAANIGLSRLNLHLLKRFNPFSILLCGVALQLVSTLLLASYSAVAEPALVVIWLLLILIVGTVGLIYGNNLSLWLDHFPQVSGAANALFGCTAFIGGALAGGVASSFHTQSLLPITGMMLGCSLAGSLLLWWGHRLQQVPSGQTE